MVVDEIAALCIDMVLSISDGLMDQPSAETAGSTWHDSLLTASTCYLIRKKDRCGDLIKNISGDKKELQKETTLKIIMLSP